MNAWPEYLKLAVRLVRRKSLNYLIFYVTAACDSRCRMCFNWAYEKRLGKEKELSINEIDAFSSKLGSLAYVTLGGGEPFLRQDLAEICKIFLRNNDVMVLSIPTNALHPEKIRNLVEEVFSENRCVILRISLSLDGVGAEHDEIRGVPGNFEKLLESYSVLANLREKNPNLEILVNTTFSKFNQEKMSEIYNYVKENMYVDMFGVTLIRGSPREKEATNISPEKYIEFVSFLEKEYKKKKFRLTHPFEKLLQATPILTRRIITDTLQKNTSLFKCHALRDFTVIDSFGDIYACEMLNSKIGNLRKEDYNLKKILKSEKAQKMRKKIKEENCYCTWECAIQNSIIYDLKKYPWIIYNTIT